jgi:predicted nucleotidyltransferase
MTISTSKYAAYLKTARRRAQTATTRYANAKRREQAWEVARRAATFIKERYPAARVRAFGSLLYPDSFKEKSDIDLAIEGIEWRDYLRIWGELDKREQDFAIDLFDVGIISKKLREHIEREGVPL